MRTVTLRASVATRLLPLKSRCSNHTLAYLVTARTGAVSAAEVEGTAILAVLSIPKLWASFQSPHVLPQAWIFYTNKITAEIACNQILIDSSSKLPL